MSSRPESNPDALRILVVDDEAAVRESAAFLLRGAGFEVAEAENAFAGLDVLNTVPVSLVVSDINMSGNERLGFVHEVQRRFPGMPIVLMTAYPSADSAIESLNSGVVAYLRKPVSGKTLLTTVQQAIGLFEAKRLVARNLEHLRSWTDELAQVERQMQHARHASQNQVIGTFLDLSLARLIASMADIRELVDVLSAAPGPVSNLRSHELETALRDAIAVLERTKRDFKSKELAELRQRLEALLPEDGRT